MPKFDFSRVAAVAGLGLVAVEEVPVKVALGGIEDDCFNPADGLIDEQGLFTP